MAAPWNDGDPQSYPYSTGGPSSGGLMGFLKGFADVVGGGASSGFGLGDASSGMAGGAAEGSRVREDFTAAAKRKAQELAAAGTDAMLKQYPGYGTLWAYDLTEGVQVLPAGWIVLAGAGLCLWLLMGGR